MDKVARARALLDRAGSRATLEVDGGITRATIGRLAAAGADAFVAGNAIFTTNDPGAEVRELRQLATKAQQAGRTGLA